jgi:hypothetical protein
MILQGASIFFIFYQIYLIKYITNDEILFLKNNFKVLNTLMIVEMCFYTWLFINLFTSYIFIPLLLFNIIGFKYSREVVIMLLVLILFL